MCRADSGSMDMAILSARNKGAISCFVAAFACAAAAGSVSSDAVAFNASCMSNGLWTGAVVMAGTRDKVRFKQAWGWMDKAKTFPMREDAVFDLASVTKAVGTTTAIAVCIDRGWIDPDAVFTNYLPHYKGTLKGPVTVRDLARHLSGFDNLKPYDEEGQVTELILQFSPVRPAGEPYEYSCGNFILLGLMAEHVSGKSLSELCRESVFEPLGMRDTRWAPVPNPDPRRVVRQAITGTLGVVSDPPARHANHPVGNAGLFSTAEDVAALCRMMLSGGSCGEKRILSEKVVRRLGERPDTRSPVAFGWRVEPKINPTSLSETTMSHTGWAGNSMWIDPVKSCYVIVLTNRLGDHEKAARARIGLAECVLEEMGRANQ